MVYDSNQVSVIFGTLNIKSGRAGVFVRIVYDSAKFTDKAGADGEVTRSKTNDERATVTIILQQTSEMNRALAAMSALDTLAPNGAGIVPFGLKSRADGSLMYGAEQAWINKDPDAEFGAESGTREWQIRCKQLKQLPGV